ncbi:MAG: GNAT family N-acetyltransferase [Actinobacteria bacterium]|nr:GNAT family N-acetyltransferase [Cyanobacteriota bacterium]MCL5772624.1 GNAT family N-acetyltransferase [Actinomycetota bacterium]
MEDNIAQDIIVKEVKDFNLDFVLKIKKLEIENLGEVSGINEWVIPVIIKYGKLIIAIKKAKQQINNGEDLIIGVNELIRDWDNFNCAFIHSFYIKKGFRNKGIGSILLKKSIEILKKDNIKKLELTVDPKNQTAIRLYEKFGFKNYEFIEDLYGKGVNRNLMICEI